MTLNAIRTAVAGVLGLPDGRSVIDIRPAIFRVDRAANARLIERLAKQLNVSGPAASGAHSLIELVAFAGAPATLAARSDALFG